MPLITLIMERNGPGAGGWVLGFYSRAQCSSRSIQIEKNGREKKKKRRKERGESESCCQPFEGHKPHLVTPYEEYSNRNPFDRERRLLPNPSIGFNGHRYSNLYSTEGSRSSHPSSQPVEDTFRALSATNNRRRVAIGVDKRKTKEWKGICILFSFFFLPFISCVRVCVWYRFVFDTRETRAETTLADARKPSIRVFAPSDRFYCVFTAIGPPWSWEKLLRRIVSGWNIEGQGIRMV